MSARAIRLHLTNVQGLGATILLRSLLPAIVALDDLQVERAFVPASDALLDIDALRAMPTTRYKRRLPNSISRALECLVFARRFDGETPILVLGDIPLRIRGPQAVLVHQPLLFDPPSRGISLASAKYGVLRWLFRNNAGRVGAFFVQTEAMRDALVNRYPEVKSRVHVIAQPAPEWLRASAFCDRPVQRLAGRRLRLFYPAASYPHKNHALLAGASHVEWPVERLVLTVPESEHPDPRASWIHCVGRLDKAAVLAEYAATDALLFLSRSESLGFPLLEAMSAGIPIVVADRPYAHAVCGSEALYFDPDSQLSLLAVLAELRQRLESGWRPNWEDRLAQLPATWSEVAQSMVAITAALRSPAGQRA
jgi:Glycosyltransferase